MHELVRPLGHELELIATKAPGAALSMEISDPNRPGKS